MGDTTTTPDPNTLEAFKTGPTMLERLAALAHLEALEVAMRDDARRNLERAGDDAGRDLYRRLVHTHEGRRTAYASARALFTITTGGGLDAPELALHAALASHDLPEPTPLAT